jgi:NAD(P)-dependent dehydrogenase (short-subunit alcohol dehydrogenase family)
MANSTFELTSEVWHGFLDVALHGAFYTLREGARAMVERAQAGEPGGSLIFCGSLMMFQGVAGKGNYAAAKAGMGAVVRSMAVEFGKYGIRANTIAPGYIKTEMTGAGEEWSDLDKHFASKTPVPRPGVPADFEAIAAYLCSDGSSFHTGDTIVIDGASVIYPAYAGF